ncbi:hypothetical protein SPACI_034710 [Sporomusa acidovorans DSM 3132]|uniref:Uncharacterized protein n=1 Tax=Sporomusa acidovorans (strain ATCC 49682 / DSM 3132 / Mol) TaxID=1123286 RepID=A0ABZ3J560_SPOA4|nr:hypothetical protein SPACI_06320 [Sporomusa acidovorans DSM 3132]SDF47195.1 hypothetical protein SAMN04488499_105116 [Sporomusa acidovorans]
MQSDGIFFNCIMSFPRCDQNQSANEQILLHCLKFSANHFWIILSRTALLASVPPTDLRVAVPGDLPACRGFAPASLAADESFPFSLYYTSIIFVLASKVKKRTVYVLQNSLLCALDAASIDSRARLVSRSPSCLITSSPGCLSTLILSPCCCHAFCASCSRLIFNS